MRKRTLRKLVAMLLLAVLVVGFIPATTSASENDPWLNLTFDARFVYAEPGTVIAIEDSTHYGLVDGEFAVTITHNGQHVSTGTWRVFFGGAAGPIFDTPGIYVFTFIPPEGWIIADDPNVVGQTFYGEELDDHPFTISTQNVITINWDGNADAFGHVVWYLRPGTYTPVPNLATASAWAHEGIRNAVLHNLVPTALQNYYTQAATRAEFTALAVALYEAATNRTITGRTQFADTDDVNVQKMAYLGVVAGVGNNRFDPSGQITREQAAVMLSRLANAIGQPFPQQPPTFADNPNVSAWAVDGVGQAQAAGVMAGVGDNRFAPQDTFTREQSILTILRMFELLD